MDSNLLKRIGGLVAVVVLLAAGCQATASPPSSGDNGKSVPATTPQGPSTSSSGMAKGAIDPCSVLSKEDISTVVGQAVSEAKLYSGSRPTCKYFLGSQDSYVVIYVFPGSKTGFQNGKTQQDENPQAVSGVGDDAYWSPSLETLNVLKGTTYFMVQFIGVKSGSIDTAKQLALKALPRLP